MVTAKESYQPGVCNIGPAEIARRRDFGVGGALLAVSYTFLASVFMFPVIFKLLVFFPAIVSAIGFVQMYFHFCVAFGLSNVFNFKDAVGKTENIVDFQARELDRKQAWKLIGIAAALAFVYTFVSALLF